MLDNLVEDISKELNMDSDIVNKVIRSEFLFVRDAIEAGELQSVHLHYLGKWAVKPARRKYFPEGFFDNIYKSGKQVYDNKE